MKHYRSIIAALSGVIIGAAIYFGAAWWAARTMDTGQVVGANIGAGIVGLLGIAIGIVSTIWLVVAIIKRW
jgi:hypothetical protein